MFQRWLAFKVSDTRTEREMNETLKMFSYTSICQSIKFMFNAFVGTFPCFALYGQGDGGVRWCIERERERAEAVNINMVK